MKKIDRRITVEISDKEKKIKRHYLFLPDCKDIEQKIITHTFNFIKCSDLASYFTEGQEDLFNEQMIALYHKLNLVKYHKQRYQSIERRLQKKYENDLRKDKFEEGKLLLEDSQLTADLESFLLQFKATLDMLVHFLNIFYGGNKKHNPLKKLRTFTDKGQTVIRHLDDYLGYHPEKKKYLADLLDYLKTQCGDSCNSGMGSLNWMQRVIAERDIIAHRSKWKYFAFQINNIKGKEKNVIPPLLTRSQSMNDALEIFYLNLLTFTEDFMALLFKPYLNNFFSCNTYDPKTIKLDSPKWYIIPSVFAQIGFGLNVQSPLDALKFLKADKIPIDTFEFLKMFAYYSGFLHDKKFELYSLSLKDGTWKKGETQGKFDMNEKIV